MRRAGNQFISTVLPLRVTRQVTQHGESLVKTLSTDRRELLNKELKERYNRGPCTIWLKRLKSLQDNAKIPNARLATIADVTPQAVSQWFKEFEIRAANVIAIQSQEVFRTFHLEPYEVSASRYLCAMWFVRSRVLGSGETTPFPTLTEFECMYRGYQFGHPLQKQLRNIVTDTPQDIQKRLPGFPPTSALLSTIERDWGDTYCITAWGLEDGNE